MEHGQRIRRLAGAPGQGNASAEGQRRLDEELDLVERGRLDEGPEVLGQRRIAAASAVSGRNRLDEAPVERGLRKTIESPYWGPGRTAALRKAYWPSDANFVT